MNGEKYIDVDYYRALKQQLLGERLRPLFDLLARYAITPNHISIFGFFWSTLSLFWLKDQYILFLLATILYYVCDGLDGLYARAIHKDTKIGHTLDKVLDFTGGLLLYIVAWKYMGFTLALPTMGIYTIATLILFVLKLDRVGGASCDFRVFAAVGLPHVGLYWDFIKLAVVFPIRTFFQVRSHRRRGDV